MWQWRKKQSREGSPTVFAMIDHFNDVSLWAMETILRELQLKNRVKTLSKIIDVCKCLRKLHSFNMLLAVLSALNSSAIRRLTHTWETVGAKTRVMHQRLDTLMSHEEHYSTLYVVPFGYLSGYFYANASGVWVCGWGVPCDSCATCECVCV